MLKEYVDWMYERGSSNGDHTLKNIEKLLDKLGNPQDKIKVIHVAGTNGKGSTCNYIYNTLSKKLKCGIFISPYMESILESITINEEKISKNDFINYIDEIKPVVEQLDIEGYHNTYFEVLTAIMYKYFYDKKVDVAVVEVGLGGKLDSTNIIKKPIASVITTISMDHINVLGNNIVEIAENKGGIIKQDADVFIYPQEKAVMEKLSEIAQSKNSKVYTFEKSEIEILETGEGKNLYNFREYKNVQTKLLGIHQVYNSALALTVLDHFKEKFDLSEEEIKEGIRETKNSGRLETISDNPKVIIDGSHNLEAMDALIESLKNFNYNRLILGFSILKDKDYKKILPKLISLADEVVITNINNPRAFTLEELENEVKQYSKNVKAIENIIEAYEYTKSISKENDLILWCGSLYLIREIRNYEKGIEVYDN